ncbi:MAG: tetratricopeptide repeat protein [Armatimonadota bacterium]|nr:tetratricopeptide repeat protein [Armatimonadota bacterium]
MKPSVTSSRKQVFLTIALICAGLAAVVAIVYLPVLDADFVGYDDELYVTRNPYVQAGPTAESLLWAFTTFAAGNWHPLTWISHMLDCAAYGLDPRGHHLTNLILHCADTVLLFLAFAAMTGSILRSALVAALFGVHPLHVESVAWVSERKDVLSTLFWMLALLAYAFYVRSPNLRRYLGVVVAFVLGLLAKPMVVSLPAVLLILDFWPLKRFGSSIGSSRSGQLLRLIVEKLPMGVLSLASSIVTYVAQKGSPGSKMGCLPDLPFSIRFDNALVSYVVYLGKTVWPANLSVIYPHPQNSIPMWKIFACAAVFAAISGVVYFLRKRHPYLLAGWLWYVVTLVPVIGIVQVGEQAMADRYTYIPLIGIFFGVVWYALRLVEQVGTRRLFKAALAAITAAVLVAYAGRTHAQTYCWQDSVSLFRHALEATRNNYVAHLNLAVALEARGDYESARRHYEEALRLQPNWVHALYNYAVFLSRMGDEASAMAVYRKVVRLQPDHALAHYNMGIIYDERGDLDAAIREYQKAVRSAPEFAPAYVNLAVDLYERGKYKQAWRLVQKAQILGFEVNQDFLRALSSKVCNSGGK